MASTASLRPQVAVGAVQRLRPAVRAATTPVDQVHERGRLPRNVTQSDEHGRHPGFPQDRQPHARARPARIRRCGPAHSVRDRRRQQPPAGRLELRHGVVVDARAAVDGRPRIRCRRGPRSGWRRPPGRRRRARRRRRRWRCDAVAPATRRRESELSPPNWPITTRRSASERAFDVSASSSRRARSRGRCRSGGRASAGHAPCRGRRPVDDQARVALEVLQRAARCGARRSRRRGRSRSRSGQRRLQLADVVAAQVGCDQHQQPVTELPRRLDQRPPGLVVAGTGRPQAAFAAGIAQRRFGRRAKKTRLGTGGWKPGGAEAALKVAYGLAALTGCQREVARNSSSSCISAPLPLAPTIFFLTSPPSNRSSVGMLITL